VPERRGSIQASVDAGVYAYIVDGLKKERIKTTSIPDLASTPLAKLQLNSIVPSRRRGPQGDRSSQWGI